MKLAEEIQKLQERISDGVSRYIVICPNEKAKDIEDAFPDLEVYRYPDGYKLSDDILIMKKDISRW